MSKLIATLNVIAWAGFWSFGYIALTSGNDGGVVVPLILAAIGGGIGVWAFMWCSRHCETTGYAKPSRSRARFEADDRLDGHA